MGLLDSIRMLYDYNHWANGLIWESSILTLTDEQFYQPFDYSVGGIHHQIIHIISAEWVWFSRLNGSSPNTMLNPADYPTREAIRTKWDEVETLGRNTLNHYTEATLESDLVYRTTSSQEQRQNIGELLLHLMNHGTDHRAQVLYMLYQLGAPTVAQDILYYLREKR
jgi:uncharacterized damage-inducible protein DinB